MKIRIGDRMVEIDEERFRAFDSLSHNHGLASGLAAGVQGIRSGDAQEAIAFMVSQLAYTEAQVYERLYTPMQYEDFLPISFEAGEWARSIRYETYDYAGRGKRSSGKGRDINKVDVAYGEVNMPVVNGNIGYDYDTEELRATAFLRKPVPETKLQAAMEGYKRHLNFVGLMGESESNLTGLFNNPNVPQGNAPNGGWAALIAAGTPDLILQDVNALIYDVRNNTNFNDWPTDVIIAPAKMALISGQPRSSTSDKTILQYLKENNCAKTEGNVDVKFSSGYGLNTAGAGNTARMMAYVKSPTRLIMHIPMPLRFLAPQLIGLSVEVPGEYKYSGVEFRYPKSAKYSDGL